MDWNWLDIVFMALLCIIGFFILFAPILIEIDWPVRRDKEYERKKKLVDPIVDKCQFIKSFIYRYNNEIVNDKNNILNNLIAADKKFDKFISLAIEKYNTCIYKWNLQNRSDILDIGSYYRNYTHYFMILIERNDPILTEINDLYSDFNYISNKLRRLGLNYCNIKLTDLNRKIERSK